MKPFKKMEITWLDSIHEGGWRKLGDVDFSENQLKHKTIGYLVFESKVSIAVAQSYGEEREDPTIDSVMQIPKCAIKKIIRF